MLSDRQIESSREALVAVVEHLGGLKIGSMVIHAAVPVCLFVGTEKRINKQTLPVRFVYDKNWPKLQIDAFENETFHTEFSVAWQRMTFDSGKKLLIIRGESEMAQGRYKLHIHIRGQRESRDA